MAGAVSFDPTSYRSDDPLVRHHAAIAEYRVGRLQLAAQIALHPEFFL